MGFYFYHVYIYIGCIRDTFKKFGDDFLAAKEEIRRLSKINHYENITVEVNG